MAEVALKTVAKPEERKAEEKSGRSLATSQGWPFTSLRREIDRLFDDFAGGILRSPLRRGLFDVEPFWHSEISWGKVPAVDVTDTDKGFEITAELPGLSEKDVEVGFADGTLTIKGEKKEEKEERKKDYFVSERRYGSFQRAFSVPDGVDADKIEATFKNGVLTVTLPKTPEAQKQEKRIAIKNG